MVTDVQVTTQFQMNCAIKPCRNWLIHRTLTIKQTHFLVRVGLRYSIQVRAYAERWMFTTSVLLPVNAQ